MADPSTGGSGAFVWVRALLLLLFVAALVLLGRAHFERTARAEDRIVMRMGIEDAIRRMRASVRNLKEVRALSDANALAKARALARMVAADGSVLGDVKRLEALARDLDVDELHVSDERGTLIASIPAATRGYKMTSSPQSAAFMPAITNAEFSLVQDPMPNGISKQPFQYAGVARIDSPGIVQVGYDARRVLEAVKMADVREVVAASRIGRGGRLTIVPISGSARVQENGLEEGCESVTADSDGFRFTVTVPVRGSVLTRDWIVTSLIVAALVLFVAFLFSLSSSFVRIALETLRSLRVFFRGVSMPGSVKKRSGMRSVLVNPVTVACFCAFLLSTGISWFVESRTSFGRATELLRTNSADIREEIMDSVNDMLYFIGNAICRHYRTPEKLSQTAVAEVMARYNIDELNVVDGRGVIIAGAMADVGFDMASSPTSAKFNRLLDGVKTYAQQFRSAIENPSIVRKYAGIAFPDAKGYIQIGFDYGRLKNDIEYRFENSVVDRHVGESGYFICADEATGEILSCGRAGFDIKKRETLAGIGLDMSSIPSAPDAVFEARLWNERCMCISDLCAFHRIIVALPMHEIVGGRNSSVLATVMILLGVFAFVAFFMNRLAGLVSSLRGFIAAEKERQERDLSVARTIQSSSLPVVFPQEREYGIFARMDTAREVGGDFFDFYKLPSGRLLFLVADVSGKGVPAAMFMMRARAIIKSCSFIYDELERVVHEANNRLAENNEAEMFVTAWLGTIDLATGEVRYVNAGHNPPMLRHRDGTIERVVSKRSLVLAAMAGVKYHSSVLRMSPGDGLLLYTDGVTEAMNADGELYGTERLVAAMSGDASFVASVREDLDRFVGDTERSDDITMLALDYHGPNGRDESSQTNNGGN